jgi:hypothetical protein
MDRMTFVSTLFAIGCAYPSGASPAQAPKAVAGVALPDSRVAREASKIAKASLPIEIYNHSLRTYLFAELIAKAKKIDHDSEIVYVSAILHDTGLSAKYMSESFAFEVDGANVAKSLLSSHGVGEEASNLAWDAIALHDNGAIAQHKQPEVKLVNSGVGADFGAYLDALTRQQVVDVLTAAPRTNFIDVFVKAAAVVAKRKPAASAHSFVADIGYRKVPGFHLPNFVDEVREDPFAGYR